MTPTREQVIDFCEAAGLPKSFSAHPGVKQAIRNAYSAGRLKWLEEAKRVCEHQAATVTRFTGTREQGANHCAAAIDQLKEQTP